MPEGFARNRQRKRNIDSTMKLLAPTTIRDVLIHSLVPRWLLLAQNLKSPSYPYRSNHPCTKVSVKSRLSTIHQHRSTKLPNAASAMSFSPSLNLAKPHQNANAYRSCKTGAPFLSRDAGAMRTGGARLPLRSPRARTRSGQGMVWIFGRVRRFLGMGREGGKICVGAWDGGYKAEKGKTSRCV